VIVRRHYAPPCPCARCVRRRIIRRVTIVWFPLALFYAACLGALAKWWLL